MNDVSKCDVIIWHIVVKMSIWLSQYLILYFQAKFGKERSELEPTKLL